ncbi:single-stranded-DNA-specific exonuclease RecJ [Methylobacterium sp. 092160098-2]|uniref:single-stranded-DNA-specific exonuclease RecJ n=1 Tax=Methylobacterium sp. 092160098-2 TaxID=3025129 RepID=UPI002381ABDD|nr:single-stranded-DNA-specific exonuclease RecJ [Methylobacterium sp. 092160098-2]MDE4914972.1 single-stranded-DNA-specific exonuclease RecJ [Methylobacterium sp. 092160098-2]
MTLPVAGFAQARRAPPTPPASFRTASGAPAAADAADLPYPYVAEISLRGNRWAVPNEFEGVDADDPLFLPKQVALLRGTPPQALESFFKPLLRNNMPDPSSLVDMDAATARIAAAVRNGETIGLLGDYDVDGATSTAIMLRWLRAAGHREALYYIPDRIREGYGPNPGAVDAIAEAGATLLLVLDSGTLAHGPIAHARARDMDVVVVDHHEPSRTLPLPDAVVVNPKRPDDASGLRDLCTAGLAFMLAVSLNRLLRETGYFGEIGVPMPDPMDLIGLAALGTVADVVSLTGLNRALVVQGLPKLDRNPGIRALVEETGETEFTPKTAGFVFGPCINAAGRIDDTRLGTLLLASEDAEETRDLARRLREINAQRQAMQKAMVETAVARALSAEFAVDPVIVIEDPEWHPGIVGLVAARVREATDKPAVVVGEFGKGSCRSVDGFDVGSAIIRAREGGLLIAGGGHRMAAGLTIEAGRIGELRRFLCAEAFDFERPATEVDVVAEVGTTSVDAIAPLEALAPYGAGNQQPAVAVIGGVARRVRILKEKHVKLLLEGPEGTTEAILFNAIGTRLGDALAASEGLPVDVLGRVAVDDYNAQPRVQIKIDDAMIARAS